MRMLLNVTYESAPDDPFQVMAWHNDFVACEHYFDISVSKEGEFGRIEHMDFLAWSSLHRAGRVTESFDGWMAKQGLEVLPANLPDDDELVVVEEVVVDAPEAETLAG